MSRFALEWFDCGFFYFDYFILFILFCLLCYFCMQLLWSNIQSFPDYHIIHVLILPSIFYLFEYVFVISFILAYRMSFNYLI